MSSRKQATVCIKCLICICQWFHSLEADLNSWTLLWNSLERGDLFVGDVLFWMQCWYPLLLCSIVSIGLVFKDPESYGRAPKWISETDSAKSFSDWWRTSRDLDLMAPSGAIHTYSPAFHTCLTCSVHFLQKCLWRRNFCFVLLRIVELLTRLCCGNTVLTLVLIWTFNYK